MTQDNGRINLRSSAILMLTALIWGGAFVGQRAGMEFIGPFLFITLRMILGAATLAIVVMVTGFFAKRRNPTLPPAQTSSLNGKRLIKAGFVCGLVLFFASSFQQVGLIDVDAGKAGFLTTLYIILVPILGIALRHKTHWNTWIAVLIAASGLYFLCVKQGMRIDFADLLMLIGAFGWALHILVIDHFVISLSQRDVLRLCVAQFCVAALLGLICSLIFDGDFPRGAFSAAGLIAALPAVLYVGVLSTGVAFTLQAVGQQGLNPTAASLIMSLESVFAVLSGMLILHEVMTLREAVGCILMFTAVVLSQLPMKTKQRP
jgi:drug/metabolite transporter (DMT)-like permease